MSQWRQCKSASLLCYLIAPASTRPHSSRPHFSTGWSITNESFCSASIWKLSSLKLFACSAAQEPRWMHQHPVFNDEQNKTSHLTVHLKTDSFATCRYISGTSVICLMSPKHRTARQVCLQWWIPFPCVSVWCVSELCVFLFILSYDQGERLTIKSPIQ